MNIKASGAYSAVELLIALALFAVMAAIAAPNLSALHHRSELRNFHSELHRFIHHARHQARSNHDRVTVCALDESSNQCLRLTYGTLTSFVDSNGNRRLETDEQILRSVHIPERLALHWAGMQPTHSIHFNLRGHTHVSNGTFSICHSRLIGSHRTLVINRQGRLRSQEANTPCPADRAR